MNRLWLYKIIADKHMLRSDKEHRESNTRMSAEAEKLAEEVRRKNRQRVFE